MLNKINTLKRKFKSMKTYLPPVTFSYPVLPEGLVCFGITPNLKATDQYIDPSDEDII